jgi:hypothetical protein
MQGTQGKPDFVDYLVHLAHASTEGFSISKLLDQLPADCERLRRIPSTVVFRDGTGTHRFDRECG